MGGMENRLPDLSLSQLAPIAKPLEFDVVALLREEHDPHQFHRQARDHNNQLERSSG